MHLKRNHIDTWKAYSRDRKEREALEEQNCQEDIAEDKVSILEEGDIVPGFQGDNTHVSQNNSALGEEKEIILGSQADMAVEGQKELILGDLKDLLSQKMSGLGSGSEPCGRDG